MTDVGGGTHVVCLAEVLGVFVAYGYSMDFGLFCLALFL